MKEFGLVQLVKKRKVVGRGGKKGKSSGRGRGGQLSRTGGRSKVGLFFEGGQMPLSRRLPRRGFTSRQKQVFEVVNLDDLEERFESGAAVGLFELRAVGLLRGSRVSKIKVLANGELSKPLHLTVNAISESARLAIEKAGGSVSLL
jgi:large subunit ribosomal protein L15